LVSLLASRTLGCRPAASPTAPLPPAPEWDRLRRLWTSVAEGLRSRETTLRIVEVEPPGSGGAASAGTEQMILFGEDREAWDRTEAEHRDALDALVAAGELRAPVADLLHLAFQESVEHLVRTHSHLMCYDPTQLGLALMRSREQLVEQLILLDDFVRSGAVSADAVAAAREVAERQIAFFDDVEALQTLEGHARLEMEARLAGRFAAGGFEADADEKKAAGLLIGLLTGEER
ncbi:MAG: hypothetical protein JXB32_05485, partial [Deltaproteobacteria bacterium]|nr:hypothetical protein [Deltaproteobacteria bacterium]